MAGMLLWGSLIPVGVAFLGIIRELNINKHAVGEKNY
jgi:hypothetical protein